MLPRPSHDSAPPPSSRSRNYEQELSSWFEKHAAPVSEVPPTRPSSAPPPPDEEREWVEDEPTTGRLPFLIY